MEQGWLDLGFLEYKNEWVGEGARVDSDVLCANLFMCSLFPPFLISVAMATGLLLQSIFPLFP